MLDKKDDTEKVEKEHPAYAIIMEKVLLETFAEKSTKRIKKEDIKEWLRSLAN